MVDDLKIDFFTNGLCSHCHSARNEIMEFEWFHKATESSWEERNKNIESKMDELISKNPEDTHDIVEHFSLDLHENQEKYPSIHRESLVITIYNFLESDLNKLCDILSQSVQSNIKLKDIKGMGIERAFLYLSKVGGIDFSNMGMTLPYIKSANKLRNSIVHNGGVLPDDSNNTFLVFVSSSKYLEGASGRHVRIKSGFITEFISVLIQFFNELDIEVQSHIKLFMDADEIVREKRK